MTAKFGRFRSSISLLRWLFIYSFLALAGIAIASGIWLYHQPLTAIKARIEKAAKASLHADKVVMRDLQWSGQLSSLSLGLEALDLSIEGSPTLVSAKVPIFALYIQPLKIFFGRIPLKIDSQGANIKFRKSNALAEAEKPATGGWLGMLPSWARYVRLNYDFEKFNVELDPQSAGLSEKDSVIKIEKASFKGLVAGLPGHFDGQIQGALNVDVMGGRYVMQGPASLSGAGYFLLEQGRPVGVKTDNLHLDLNRSLISAPGKIEKSAAEALEAHLKAQIFLDAQENPHSIEVSQGDLHYDEVHIAFGATRDFGKGASLKWSLVKTEVSKFHFPIENLRRVPFAGLMELSGVLNFFEKGPAQGNWRIGMNNFRAKASELEGLTQKTSTGEIRVSFVSEGGLEGGQLSSPRTEFQLEGSNAQLEFSRGALVKPADDNLEIILKASLKDDTLKIEKLHTQLHTLDLNGLGELGNFSDFVNGGIGNLKLSGQSNRVDLSKWLAYFQLFRKPPPLEGFVEASGSVEAKIGAKEFSAKDFIWRVDRFNVSNMRATFDKESFEGLGLADSAYVLHGPFSLNFLFQGRGQGSRVDRASLLSQIDFSKVSLLYKDTFRKPAGIPLLLDLSAEQARNQVNIRRGRFVMHTLDLGFAGTLLQGSKRTSIELAMAKPVHLSDWRELVLNSPNIPVDGLIQWKGRLGFPHSGNRETDLDWKGLSLEGELKVNDFSGRIGDMKNPIRNANGRILFQPTGIVVPQWTMFLGKTAMSLSGEASALEAGKKSFTLSQLLTHKAWDLSSQLSLSRLDSQDFMSVGAASTDEGPSLGDQIRKWLKNPLLEDSRLKVALRAKEGSFGVISYNDLNMRALWEKGAFKMEPFSLSAFGGKVSGSVEFDASGFYSRKDPPQSTASLKVQNIDLKQLTHVLKPEMERLLAGHLSGSLTAASQGFEPEEIIRNSRARLTGNLSNGQFETLQYLKKSLNSFLSNSAARQYLLRQAQGEPCLQKNFNASLDAQVTAGQVEVQSGKLNFATGSSIEMKGQMEKDLHVKLGGDFLAGPSCIGGEVQDCLKEGSGRAAIPFTITGLATSPSVQLDSAGLAAKITSCMARKIAQKAQEAVKNEVQKHVGDLKDQATDALKKIFK